MQGLTSSPYLFDIYMEDLVIELESKGHWGRLCTDDLITTAKDNE